MVPVRSAGCPHRVYLDSDKIGAAPGVMFRRGKGAAILPSAFQFVGPKGQRRIDCEYGWEYGLVSTGVISVQFVAETG